MTTMGRGLPSWGILTPAQKLAVRAFIKGRRLRDYGCSNLHITRQLLELGARHVEGVDAAPVKVPKELKARLKVIHSLYYKCPPSTRTAFISWPDNADTGIEIPLRNALHIIYLGKNTDGFSCGTLTLWRELRRRRILAHIPAPENDLIIYGGAALRARRLLPEEFAGSTKDRVYKHDELHRPGRRLGSTLMRETVWDLIVEALGL